MNRQAEVGRICAHFDREPDFGDQVTRMRPDDGATKYAVGLRVEQ